MRPAGTMVGWLGRDQPGQREGRVHRGLPSPARVCIEVLQTQADWEPRGGWRRARKKKRSGTELDLNVQVRELGAPSFHCSVCEREPGPAAIGRMSKRKREQQVRALERQRNLQIPRGPGKKKPALSPG